MTRLARFAAIAFTVLPLLGQQTTPGPGTREPGQPAASTQQQDEGGLIPRPDSAPDAVLLPRGTRIPLALINSISTKNSAPGDKLYLQSVYPVVVNGRILVPPGTYVAGVVTEVKRPGRVKGRGELHLRFEQMILPNGTIRDFTGSIAALDGTSEESLDRESGKVESEGAKGEDARDVVQAAGAGASIGTLAGVAGRSPMRGLGIGSTVGLAAGILGVLLTRGPEAILERGSQVEMVLDRDLAFTQHEMTFANPLQGPPLPAPNYPANRNPQDGGALPGIPPFL